MKKYLIFITAIFIIINISIINISQSVSAQSLLIKDFAYGFVLNLKGDGPIYKIEIPEPVYKGVLRKDLEDIRVFNGNGETVPHVLKLGDLETSYNELIASSVNTAQDSEELLVESAQIPFFPLYASKELDNNSDISMSIIKNDDGTIIRVESSQTTNNLNQSITPAESDKNITAYILDMSKITPYPAQLKLEWSNGSDHFVKNIVIEGSNDLTTWDYVTEQTIAELNFQGNSIYQNYINLISKNSTSHNFKYLRILWLDKKHNSNSNEELDDIRVDALESSIKERDALKKRDTLKERNALLNKITALFPQPVKEIKREWIEITEGSFNKDNKMVIEFDSKGYFPIDSVQIKLREPNSIINASIESAFDYNSRWQKRCEGVFYTLKSKCMKNSTKNSKNGLEPLPDSTIQNSDKCELSNQIYTFLTASDRFWRIKVNQDGAGLSNSIYSPILQLGYRPYKILFLARGNPPYTLAYGSAKLLKKSSASKEIPDMIFRAVSKKEISEAEYGEPKIISGEEALKIPMPPFPWKKYILWASLICGVLILSFMVWSLSKKMRSNNDFDEK